MAVRSLPVVLIILALYAIGLFGVWEYLSDRKFHWALAAFPCALLGIGLVPFLGRAPKAMVKPELLDEDRSE